MDIRTLLFGTIGGGLALFLRPRQAFIVFLAVLFLNSQNLGVAIGSIDFSSARIVTFALAANCFIRSRQLIRGLRWGLLDTLVLSFFMLTTLSLFQSEPMGVALEYSAGAFVDTFLPFFLFRLCVRSKPDLILIIKSLIIISLPLGIAGVVESSTGYNYIGLYGPAWRDGHYRAYGTFQVHIAFGMFFAVIIPLCASLWKMNEWPKWFLAMCFFCCLCGLLSTWSSGPIFALYFSFLVFCTYPVRRAIPLLIVMGVAGLTMVDLLSNRHWYDVLTRFGLSASTSQYRIDLYHEAFGGGMTGHWLFGWGLAANLYSTYDQFPWEHRDMTSFFISTLAKNGLCGIVPLLGTLVSSIWFLLKSLKQVPSKADHWLVWSLFAMWVGLNCALLTVSILSQILTLYFVLLACFSTIGADYYSLPERSQSRFRSPRTAGANLWVQSRA